MKIPYEVCPTCAAAWALFPPVKIDGEESVRCIECKAVYPLTAQDQDRPADVTVEVKPLEWRQHPDGETKLYEGVAVIGNNYTVIQAWWGAQNKWGWIGDGEFYHSETEARMACNADYERRIISALSHQPAPVAVNASAEARLRENSMRGLTDLERTLLIASKAAQNYIANTESELGMALKSGELLRAAIAKAEACEISAHPHASDCDKQGER